MSNLYAEQGLMILNALVPEQNPYAFRLDEDGDPIQPVIVLCRRNGDKINVIENVSEIKQTFDFTSVFELSFNVSEYANGKRCEVWDDIKDFMLVYMPQYELWFEIYVTIKDNDGLIKNITATHLNEAELSATNLYGIEINSEDDLKAHDYQPTVFYNEEDASLSLINRLLDKMPHYSIYHIDDSLKSLQRNFDFDGSSIMDAFDDIAEECECVFIFGEADQYDGSITRTISVYDMLDYCEDCGERGEFDDGFCSECGSKKIIERYGNDTNVFISNENLANEITFSNDTGSMKNCFHLEAGDEYMTSAIVSCNLGSQFMWYMPEETRLDMSQELRTKLMEYDSAMIKAKYEDEHVFSGQLYDSYNELVEKYWLYKSENKKLDTIVGYPDLIEAQYQSIDFESLLQTSLAPTKSSDVTSAKEQAEYITTYNMSPIGVKSLTSLSKSSADSQVKAYAKVYVDTSKYKISIQDSSLNGATWTGAIILESYTDDEDKIGVQITIQFNEDLETYTKQKIEKVLAKEEQAPYGVVNLYNQDLEVFKKELKRYSVDNLQLIANCGQAAHDILTQDGHYQSDSSLYESLYVPLLSKKDEVDKEIKVREGELEIVQNVSSEINSLINSICKEMGLKEFLGDLWIEFISYRREDSYSNSNYISDGLENDEMIKQAKLFCKVAEREIKKSASLQHQIQTSLKNLLTMPEFNPIVYKFRLGNWLRIKIDGNVYKLRLASYVIDYDSLDDIQVTFTDIREANSLVAQVKRTFAQSKAKSGSYSSTSYQMVTDTAVKNGQTGIIVRTYDDDDSYDSSQLKVLSNGIYTTDDDWETVKVIGQNMYEDQDNKRVVISDDYDLYVHGQEVTELLQDNGSSVLQSAKNYSDSNLVAAKEYADTYGEDYIIAQGTSGVWRYRKWNSGVAECWFNSVYHTDVNATCGKSSWANGYESNEGYTQLPNFPFTFSNVPNCSIRYLYGDSGWNGDAMIIYCGDAGDLKTRPPKFKMWRGTSLTIGHPRFSCYAIGQWE